MNAQSILSPMLAMAGLTFLVLLRIPFVRFRAALQGRVKASDFAMGESEGVPPDVALPNRNYMNLLEMPTVFYALCMAMFVTNQVGDTDLLLAWAYVALRALHSIIHLSYNHVIHRLTVFATSNFVLAALWLRLVLALYG